MHFSKRPTLFQGQRGMRVHCRIQKVQSVPGLLAIIVGWKKTDVIRDLKHSAVMLVSGNLDNRVSIYIRQWLDLLVSATLTSLILTKNQFGLILNCRQSNSLSAKLSLVIYFELPLVLISRLCGKTLVMEETCNTTCIAITKR